MEKLQSSSIAKVTGRDGTPVGSKVQQYLQLRSVVETASYTPAAYLQAVGGWRQRQAVAQLRTGSSWLAVETARRLATGRSCRGKSGCVSDAAVQP